jgi:hypothetical protein
MRLAFPTSLCALLCLVFLTPACGEDPTSIVVKISAEPGIDILVPDDVNQLKISVEVEAETIWGPEIFPLQAFSPPKPLKESITFRPGQAADDTIRVVVTGMYAGDDLVSGQAEAKFISTKIQHADASVSWLPGVCLDRDDDGYGKGPNCVGVGNDCDDSNPEVNPSVRETCNGIDDDCDGKTDNIPEQDQPRCTRYKGICKLARKACAGGVWQDCAPDSYGVDYEKDEVTCDMQDNDCDGAIDEGCVCIPDTTRKCDAPDLGECDAGTQWCQRVGIDEGKWVAACDGAISPVTEQCNLLDDDCDGETDEDFDKQNDSNHCGQCHNACGANLRCQNGTCLPAHCPGGFSPAITNNLPVCISALQSATKSCKAFDNCAALVADGKVGYGGNGLILPNPLPPGLDELENPITVWTQIAEDDGDILNAHFVCLNTTPEADGEGDISCPNCYTVCVWCDPDEDCPTSLTNCAGCGCKLPYWCHLEIQ